MRPSVQLLAVAMLLGSPALAAPPAASTPMPSTRPTYARAHRLAMNLGFGFGNADLSQVHRGIDEYSTAVQRQYPGVTVQKPQSGIQINAEIAFRYYFPYYLLAQVGCDAVYNKASGNYSGNSGGLVYGGPLNNDNLAIEIPILVGGYYPFFGRLYVYGAVGPAVVVYPRVFLDDGPDFQADTTVGAHVLVGADFMLADHVSLGLELRYRYLRTGDLKEKNSGIPAGQLLGGGSYNLDLSGVSLGINLRFYLL